MIPRLDITTPQESEIDYGEVHGHEDDIDEELAFTPIIFQPEKHGLYLIRIVY